MKPLPPTFRYEYLGPNETYPVIVNANLNRDQPMGDPSNAMIYAKLCQLHNDYTQMQEYNETQDRLLYETWSLTRRMHAWHLERGDYEEEEMLAQPPQRRNRTQQQDP